MVVAKISMITRHTESHFNLKSYFINRNSFTKMDPPQLKLCALEQVLKGLKCTKVGCAGVPMAFQVHGEEKAVWCQKHYEISTFYHDGLTQYNTLSGGHNQEHKIYVGENVIYIHNFDLNGRTIQYVDIKPFVGSSYGEMEGNTVLFKKNKVNEYVWISNSMMTRTDFDENGIEDEIVEYYSFVDKHNISHPVAVGTKNIYFPGYWWQYIPVKDADKYEPTKPIDCEVDIVTLAYRIREYLGAAMFPRLTIIKQIIDMLY